MEAIVFIETTKSGSSREAIIAAAKLGYATILLTENRRFLKQRKEFSEVTKMILVTEITEESIRPEIYVLQNRGIIIKGLLSFVDPHVSLAAKLMNEYCHSDISVDALKIMEDKATTRNVLNANATTPYFDIYHPQADLQLFIKDIQRFPLIIKSAVSKASKDVYLVEDKDSMETVMNKLLVQYPSQKIVIEEYLNGPQFLVEVLVHNEKINIVAIIEQEVTKTSKFIITGYDLQLNIPNDIFEKLYDSIESIILEFQVKNAACHFEFRYVNKEWKLIEVNPRISGGAMNQIINEAFGINLVKETIRLFLGHTPNLKKKFEHHIYTHYITINSYGYLLKVTGRNRALTQPGVRQIYVKPRIGTFMTPPTSMGNRYGYVIASGKTSTEAKTNAIRAASNIKFYLEPIEE